MPRDDHKIGNHDGPAISPMIADRRTAPRIRIDEPSSSQLMSLETYTRGNQLIDRVTVAMDRFEAAEKAQHAADPDAFPLMRSEDNWWNEFRAWVAYDYAVTVMGIDPVQES